MRLSDFTHENQLRRRPHAVAPVLASVHVIFCVHRYKTPLPGTCDAGLAVTINSTAKVLRRNGVHAEVWSVQTVADLFQKLQDSEWGADRPITHVIIATPTFVNPNQFAQLSYRWTDIEFVQLNHSGLAYISIDKNGMKYIRDVCDLQMAAHNIRVAGNNQRFGKWLGDAFGIDGLWLPNLYDCESFKQPVVARQDHDPLRIGSFGVGRPWKNQLVAAEAAVSIARRMNVGLELFVNKDPWDANRQLTLARQELFANLVGCKLITITWTAWPAFRRIVGRVDICLNPSFDETFCVICADALAEGVPPVATGAMEWLPRSLWVEEPWDPASVTRTGMALLHDKVGAVHDGRNALRNFVEAGVHRWINYLTA